MLKLNKLLFTIPSSLCVNKLFNKQIHLDSQIKCNHLENYINKQFNPNNIVYKHGSLTRINTTITRFDKDDGLKTLLHSTHDNPAKIKISNGNVLYFNLITKDDDTFKFNIENIIQNPTYIYHMIWYHFGVKYRYDNPTLPAEIGFYPNQKVWFERFHDFDGELHSYGDNPSYIEYCYSDDIKDKSVLEHNWHIHGKLIKRIQYCGNVNETKIYTY